MPLHLSNVYVKDLGFDTVFPSFLFVSFLKWLYIQNILTFFLYKLSLALPEISSFGVISHFAMFLYVELDFLGNALFHFILYFFLPEDLRTEQSLFLWVK